MQQAEGRTETTAILMLRSITYQTRRVGKAKREYKALLCNLIFHAQPTDRQVFQLSTRPIQRLIGAQTEAVRADQVKSLQSAKVGAVDASDDSELKQLAHRL
jgi:hypothetical protein